MPAHITKIEPTRSYIHLDEEHATTSEIVLLKKVNSNLQETQRSQEHAKLHKWYNQQNPDCGKLQGKWSICSPNHKGKIQRKLTDSKKSKTFSMAPPKQTPKRKPQTELPYAGMTSGWWNLSGWWGGVLLRRGRRGCSWAGVFGSWPGVVRPKGQTTRLLQLGHCGDLFTRLLDLLLEILLKPEIIGTSAQHSPLASHLRKSQSLSETWPVRPAEAICLLPVTSSTSSSTTSFLIHSFQPR